MDGVSNYTPDKEIALSIDAYGLKIGIVRYEPSALAGLIEFELFKGVLAVDIGDDKIPVLGFEATIHDHDITIEDACITHGVAFHVGVERSFRMGCHFARKVYALACMVGSGRRKSGMDGLRKFKSKFGLLGVCNIN